jgi:hypothetical protein
MSTFTVVIRRIGAHKNIVRKFPSWDRLPRGIIDHFCHLFPPAYLSQVVGVRSEAARKEIVGWLVAYPLTPKTMLEVPLSSVHQTPIQMRPLAERQDGRTPSLARLHRPLGMLGPPFRPG